MLFDPQTKLVVTLVVGRRTADTLFQAFTDFFDRTDGALPELITTDEYAAYEAVIYYTYGVWHEELEFSAEDLAALNEAEQPRFYFPEEVAYATVHKERRQGRVVKVEQRTVLGTAERVAEALEHSSTSQTVNTSYVERWNGTQRHFNARKARKVYTFSKELSYHEAVTWLVVVWYNFCWLVRTLRQKVQEEPPRYHQRTPAMAAGLAEQPWTLEQLMTYPLYPGKPPATSADRENANNTPGCGHSSLEGG